MWVGDSFIISGLKRKHAEILGIIADLERQLDQHRANLVHIDATLRLIAPEIDLEQIPVRHHAPKRSPYFGRGEITRTCLEAFRDTVGDGWLSADEIAVAAMNRKDWTPKGIGAREQILYGGFCKLSTHLSAVTDGSSNPDMVAEYGGSFRNLPPMPVDKWK